MTRGLKYVAVSSATTVVIIDTERYGIQALCCATAGAETCHRLHKLGDLTRATHRAGRGIGGEATKLPIQSNLAQGGGSGDLIVGDVVDLERAGRDVAHDHVGFAGAAAEITDADDLPIQPHRPMKAVLVIWLLLISSTINPPGLLLRYAGRGGGYRHPPGRMLVITGMAEAARRLPSGDRYCSARHAVRNHVLGSRRR